VTHVDGCPAFDYQSQGALLLQSTHSMADQPGKQAPTSSGKHQRHMDKCTIKHMKSSTIKHMKLGTIKHRCAPPGT